MVKSKTIARNRGANKTLKDFNKHADESLRGVDKPAVIGFDFSANEKPQKVPDAFKDIAQLIRRSSCKKNKEGAVILQRNTGADGMVMGNLVVYNKHRFSLKPRVGGYHLVLVWCLKGGADCFIVGGHWLRLRKGRFQVLLLPADCHECYFPAGLSAFGYILIPVKKLGEIAGMELFKKSQLFGYLKKRSARHVVKIIARKHQRVTEDMALQIRALMEQPVGNQQRDAIASRMILDLFSLGLHLASPGNLLVPPASGLFDALYGQAEKGYEVELRAGQEGPGI